MDIRQSKKSLRSRCANPECGQQFRHARSSRKWCSPKCRKVVFLQRKRRAAVEALVRVLAAVQDAKAATAAQIARAAAKGKTNLAGHRRKEAEQRAREAAEQQARAEQQAAEQERARPRTPTPPAGPITVTFAPAPMFPGTPLPPDQQPPWR
jgi:hypothetical protein